MRVKYWHKLKNSVMKAILVTGTDTGVGKTFVSYNLLYTLKEKGLKVGYLKPVETGAIDLPQDGSLLASLTGQPLEEVVPVRFRLPLSPYAGIMEEGKDFSLQMLKEHYLRMREKYEFLLVEGAGGVAVPIKKGYNYAHLARDWELPLLLVARAGLGTINHSFLSWHYIKSIGLELIGIVMNRFEGKDVSERTNPLIVEELTGTKVLKLPAVDGLLLSAEHRELLARFVGF
ncbi:MAG: dethiobiotin synthase [Aquificaceae bacterium]|nr:dethiobiotin synthase [Aquificaceae bacterium]MCX8060665.1 dethiobiotin synthase [Aquificaceae bacterium]MDW8097699.1 dethiobiotin synthase [Aquificaceae bacterium]